MVLRDIAAFIVTIIVTFISTFIVVIVTIIATATHSSLCSPPWHGEPLPAVVAVVNDIVISVIGTHLANEIIRVNSLLCCVVVCLCSFVFFCVMFFSCTVSELCDGIQRVLRVVLGSDISEAALIKDISAASTAIDEIIIGQV